MEIRLSAYNWTEYEDHPRRNYGLFIRDRINKMSTLNIFRPTLEVVTIDYFTNQPVLPTIISTCGKTRIHLAEFQYELYAAIDILKNYRKGLLKQIRSPKSWLKEDSSDEHTINPPKLLAYISRPSKDEYLVMQTIDNDNTLTKLFLTANYNHPLHIELRKYPEPMTHFFARTRDDLKKNNDLEEIPLKDFVRSLDNAMDALNFYYKFNQEGVEKRA